MNIDWSKAPEGTEAGYEGSRHLYSAWYRKAADGTVEQICPGAGVHTWQDMGGRRDFPFGSVLRPVLKASDQEELEKFITGICELLGWDASFEASRRDATKLFAAGYRKFEIVEEDV
jgi:hypothetical protein